jgi:hypothetical protein
MLYTFQPGTYSLSLFVSYDDSNVVKVLISLCQLVSPVLYSLFYYKEASYGREL